MKLIPESSKRTRRVLGISIFSIGLLVGMLFNALAVWSDLEGLSFWGGDEALAYNSAQPLDAKLNSLHCPLLISPGETRTVTAVVSNPLDKPIQSILQANISSPEEETGIRRDMQELQLSPGESRTFTWMVTPEDRRYDRVILVRLYLYQRLTSGPARTAHCGILVNDQLGLGSGPIIAILLAGSLLGMAVGSWMWARSNGTLKDRSPIRANGRIFLAGTVLAGMGANLAGSWLFGSGMFVLTLLTLLALFEDGFLPRQV